jgi:hypothetical protein
MIPKIIWQTHENEYDDLLPFQKNMTNTWKNLNPGWDYRYVSARERSIEVEKYDSFLYTCYLQADKVRQSDIWRYVSIYNYGGFYADMDSMCIDSIENSLSNNYKNEEFVASSIGFQHLGVNNSNFGSVKNSKIIKYIIDSVTLYYKARPLKDISKLSFGIPENATFSNIVIKNKELVCFNNDYFSHSSTYKKIFDPTICVTDNNEKIKYLHLAKKNNWILL